MVELSRVITDPLGFHARPVARFAAEAQRWQSDITVCAGERGAQGRDAVALLGLDAGPGTEIAVRIEGPDEADAAEFIAHVLRDL